MRKMWKGFPEQSFLLSGQPLEVCLWHSALGLVGQVAGPHPPAARRVPFPFQLNQDFFFATAQLSQWVATRNSARGAGFL